MGAPSAARQLQGESDTHCLREEPAPGYAAAPAPTARARLNPHESAHAANRTHSWQLLTRISSYARAAAVVATCEHRPRIYRACSHVRCGKRVPAEAAALC